MNESNNWNREERRWVRLTLDTGPLLEECLDIDPIPTMVMGDVPDFSYEERRLLNGMLCKELPGRLQIIWSADDCKTDAAGVLERLEQIQQMEDLAKAVESYPSLQKIPEFQDKAQLYRTVQSLIGWIRHIRDVAPGSPYHESPDQFALEDLIDVCEASIRAGVSERTITTWCKNATKPCHRAKLVGSRWIIPGVDLPEHYTKRK